MSSPDTLSFSAVRFTDSVTPPTDPSDKSLGYFQSSATADAVEPTFWAKRLAGRGKAQNTKRDPPPYVLTGTDTLLSFSANDIQTTAKANPH